MTGATMNTSWSAVRGMMSSFSGSLSASAIGCSRPKGPARFGPGRFCIRPMTRRSAQIMNMVVSSRKRKTIATFSSTSHQMSWLKSLSVGSGGGSREHLLQRPLRASFRPPQRDHGAVSRAEAGADGSSGLGRGFRVTGVRDALGRRARPGSPAAGSQTTWSAIGTTSTGTVTEPRSVATVTLSPSATPASAAVAADILATTGRAVPASDGSPSCIRPLSSSWRQVASRTSSTPEPSDVVGRRHAGPGSR